MYLAGYMEFQRGEDHSSQLMRMEINSISSPQSFHFQNSNTLQSKTQNSIIQPRMTQTHKSCLRDSTGHPPSEEP